MAAASPASPKAAPGLAVLAYFQQRKDPRRRHRRLHLLTDIIALASCAVLAGAQDWQEIELFSRKRRAWFARFLKLPNGIPAPDTFERVFDRINPQGKHIT